VTGVVVSGKTQIPVRDPSLLMLYAGAEHRPDELPDLVAEILARAVERRRAYIGQRQPLTRVRGRIDVLKTESMSMSTVHLAAETPAIRECLLSVAADQGGLCRSRISTRHRLNLQAECIQPMPGRQPVCLLVSFGPPAVPEGAT
jgi:hypothetical protein